MWWTLLLMPLATGDVFDNSTFQGLDMDTVRHWTNGRHGARHARGIDFGSIAQAFAFKLEDTALEVEVGFSIPFIKVPIRPGAGISGTPIGPFYPPVVVNVASLVVAAVFATTVYIIIPFFFPKPYHPFGRKENEEGFDFWQRVEDIRYILSTGGVDIESCSYKGLCSSVAIVRQSSFRDTFDNLISSWWVERLMVGTKMQLAVEAGRSGENCGARFHRCFLDNSHLQSAFQIFMSSIKRK